MTRYLINFSYDGSNYNGYQKQKGLNTIQGKMEEALFQINNHTDIPDDYVLLQTAHVVLT